MEAEVGLSRASPACSAGPWDPGGVTVWEGHGNVRRSSEPLFSGSGRIVSVVEEDRAGERLIPGGNGKWLSHETWVHSKHFRWPGVHGGEHLCSSGWV